MTERPAITMRTLCIDCSDAHAMADFHGRLLGWEPTFTEPDYVPPVWPQTMAEQRMMMHLDILVEDLEASTAHALEAGGRLAELQLREDLRVVLDPSGHPLCLFRD